MNLHICSDEKFINGAIELFENYSPNSNIFIIEIPNVKYKVKYVRGSNNTIFMSLSDKSSIKKIQDFARKYGIQRVYIHNLTQIRAAIALTLYKKFSIKLYWIFYGADLYTILSKKKEYDLYDYYIDSNKTFLYKLKKEIFNIKLFCNFGLSYTNSLKDFFLKLDYFCFWNHHDYHLFRKHFQTSAKYKYFIYYNVLNLSEVQHVKKEPLSILINHSASVTGNHLTVIKKLISLKGARTLKRVVTPLNYGNKSVVNAVKNLGEFSFGNKYYPILDFLPKDDYYALLNSIAVAIFGSRRQEAGGNILYLLSVGTKVFLREDNNMIQYLKEAGFIIFSFENDLNSVEDLAPLREDQISHNQFIYHKIFNKNSEIEMMKEMLAG